MKITRAAYRREGTLSEKCDTSEESRLQTGSSRRWSMLHRLFSSFYNVKLFKLTEQCHRETTDRWRLKIMIAGSIGFLLQCRAFGFDRFSLRENEVDIRRKLWASIFKNLRSHTWRDESFIIINEYRRYKISEKRYLFIVLKWAYSWSENL